MAYENNQSSSSSSSSSSDDGLEILRKINQDETAIPHMIEQNTLVLEHHYNELNNQVRRRGSIPGHIVINRGREAAAHNLFIDYFSNNPRYNDVLFRQRFRMSQNLFIRIVDAVKDHDSYFQ